jgi:hypothetical protein
MFFLPQVVTAATRACSLTENEDTENGRRNRPDSLRRTAISINAPRESFGNACMQGR